MKKHTKIYLQHFQLTGHEFIPCEVCGVKSVDIHHIECRGKGGSKEKDVIENLMAVCRACHLEFGDKTQHIGFLKEKHEYRMNNPPIA